MSVHGSQPFFSVVIPTYNSSAKFKEVLCTVLQQTYQNFEVIIVDDCSTDLDLLKQVIDEQNSDKLFLHVHQENKNGAAARNTGIEQATGQYVSFLDSDDLWPLNRLRMVKDAIDSCSEPEITLFYGKVRKCDWHDTAKAKGKVLPSKAIGEQSVSDYLFVNDGLIQTSTIVCAVSMAKAIKFDERFVRHQDYDFCLRADAEGGHFYFIDAVLSNWMFTRGGSVLKKGANFKFCQFWLTEMTPFFSNKAKQHYELHVLAPIAFESGHFLQGVKLLGSNMLNAGLLGLSKALFKSSKSVVKYVIR